MKKFLVIFLALLALAFLILMGCADYPATFVYFLLAMCAGFCASCIHWNIIPEK
jgi:hypothetical protein